MGKIDTSGWKEFRVGDLFAAERGKVKNIQPLCPGETPIIAAGAYNQGIAGMYEIDSAYENRITISCNGAGCGSTFYHPYKFNVNGDAITLIEKNSMSDKAKSFIACILNGAFTRKYSYEEKCSPQKALDEIVRLPATPDGDPDWAYMESYMANLEAKVAESLTMLQAAKDAEKKKVDTREWGEFHLYDIFSICMGNKFDRSKMCEVDEGINFVGRSALTNGVACTVTSVEDKKGNTVQPYPAGDITIALGGSIGAAFVQDREFYTSQNVCVLHTDNPSITERVKWFVAASITASCGNYEAFTNELNGHIRTDFIIRLPMDKTGQPDWAYMEEYMRKVEEKAKNVLNHFEKDRNGV